MTNTVHFSLMMGNISISFQITAATFSNISNYCRQLPAISGLLRQNTVVCSRLLEVVHWAGQGLERGDCVLPEKC